MSIAVLITTALIAAPNVGTPADPPKRIPKRLNGVAPWADLYVDGCKDKLAAAGWTEGYRFNRRTPVERAGSWRSRIYCHVPQQVNVRVGPTGVKYRGWTPLSCAMSLALTRFEAIAQQEARRVFGTKYERPVRDIKHMGTYNCRRLRTGSTTQSQHSFANGLDFAQFRIAGWGWVNVKKHWTSTRKRHAKARKFLKQLSKRLRNEGVFSNVIDPDSDKWHADHIHVDLAPVKRGRPSPALKRVHDMPSRVATGKKKTRKRR